MTSGDGPDRIEVRGLRVVGTHGLLPEEQHRGQLFEIDLDITADLTAAGRTDALEEGIALRKSGASAAPPSSLPRGAAGASWTARAGWLR